jgi:hypothetical protein
MIKNVFFTKLSFLYILGILFLSSCVRERDTETDMSAELAMNEFYYHDISNIADDAATKNTGENLSNYRTRGYCAAITHDKLSDPKTIIIDFGAANCMCNDGRNRRGQILVSYTNNYEDSGSVHNITLQNYFVNDHFIMGSNVVENKGLNGASQPFYSSIVDGKILKPDVLDTLFYSANHTITMVQGSTTPVWGDDIFHISGIGSGRNALKTYYAMTISEPLVKDVLGCRFFNTGKIEMQPQGKALRTIDFGDGSCDNDATVTINNKTFNIKL